MYLLLSFEFLVDQGEFPTIDVTWTPGHEFCGIVRAVGRAVTNVKIGDRVACDPQQ